ncbi:PucR family transcriptional regulator [Nocardioides flavescens]|uniref:PucR family transcriptional regulator n=1 Tax=Nocardioides flavescens TaxID=2691959 RepID=A0A6L7EQR7_9ACTN|nr:helix-turn-helix domain-containing protein [Nocardioides flavescens]MXG89653.1 PucR family transcriptional regulator [Nocardioides flavescens]
MPKLDEAQAIAALARIDALHTGLTQIALEGGDLSGIAAEVGRVLEVGVAFTSTDGRERAGALDEATRSALSLSDLLDPTGRLRTERMGGGAPVVPDGEARALRVAAGGADLARLVCVRTDGPLTDDDVHALERAAAVAALLITRQEAVTAVENKYQGDFLRDLLLRRSADPAYVAEHAETFGWDLDRPLVVVAAEIDPGRDEPASSLERRQWQERFSAAWRQVSATLGEGIASVDFSSEVVTLLPVAPTDLEPHPGHDLVHRAVVAIAGDRGGGRRPFSVGVSRVARSVAELPEAYAQARRALEVGYRVSGTGSATFFDQLGLHRLIALIPDERELRAFVRDVLGPLSESTKEAAQLRETLQVLLDTNFNLAEAARVQFFHYNTIRYRLSKLERLLGPLSDDPHLRLNVAVALRVYDLANT